VSTSASPLCCHTSIQGFVIGRVSEGVSCASSKSQDSIDPRANADYQDYIVERKGIVPALVGASGMTMGYTSSSSREEGDTG